MKIKFIEGTGNNGFANYLEYTYLGKLHQVRGCYVRWYPYGDLKIFFQKSELKPERNTIYIVKQNNKIRQTKTFIHELLHWLADKFTEKERPHRLIDKYL